METKRRTDGADRAPSIEGKRSVAEAAERLAKSGLGVLLVVEGRRDMPDDVVGLVTERDICRAVAEQGTGAYDLCVWVIADRNYPRLDVTASSQDRLRTFCERKANHIVLMDGHSVSGILNVWDCAQSHVHPIA